MAKAKRARSTDAERKVVERVRKAEVVGSVLNTFIRYGGLTLIAYWAYRIVDVLAGRRTAADIGIDVSFIADIGLSRILVWMVGVGGIMYGLAERRLRRKAIDRLQGRVKELEQRIDPGRTSSNLTTTGDTRPEDRL